MLFTRKAQQTSFVNGICSAFARCTGDIAVFPFTLVKTKLEVGMNLTSMKKNKMVTIFRVPDVQQ